MNYVELTENDMAQIQVLNFTDVAVLNAACKVLKIDLQRNCDHADRWYATPKDAPVLQGTLIEIAAFVRGYGLAWSRGRSRVKRLAELAFKDLEEKLATW